jgi:predicted  nucleic acid-binding Zn-ribbon protein
MSEALRLAEWCDVMAEPPHSASKSGKFKGVSAELRRLAPIEAEWAALSQDTGKAEGEIDRLRAELQQAREERTALLVNEQNLREELLAIHKTLADAVLNAEQGWSRYENANRLSNSLQAELAALRAVPAIPEGWKLVPVEPTP